jgi:hypothetical protein
MADRVRRPQLSGVSRALYSDLGGLHEIGAPEGLPGTTNALATGPYSGLLAHEPAS